MKVFKNKYFLITVAFFGIVYSLIALVNHYNFRTYALDLGVYTNAMWDYLHFQWNDCSSFREVSENILVAHFDLYLILLSPLTLIFRSYTLLIVQIVSVLLGGAGVYKYFSSLQSNNRFPLLATIFFFLFFGIFSAIAYDFHSNVVAAMIVPWFLYCFRQEKHLAAFILLFVMLIAKENVSLWLAFICLGMLVEYRKDKIALRYLLIFFATSVVYFILIIGVVMPAISKHGVYLHYNYTSLGNSLYEVVKNLVSHPLATLKMLFVNHTHNPYGDYVKLETHILLLISGLWMLIFKPQYLIMLIPVYLQKLCSDCYLFWSINYHYSIEFAPILAIGVFSVIANFRNKIWAKIAASLMVLGCLVATIRIMDHTVIYTNKNSIRIYQAGHYSRDYDVKLVHEKLNSIPSDAVVSAQSPFLPHLALRDNVYQFPIIKNAEYIIYSKKEVLYPLTKESFETFTDSLLNSNNWQVLYKSDDVVLLKRFNR